jgi:hypothetical protein
MRDVQRVWNLDLATRSDAMQLFKRLSLGVASATFTACGGLLIFSAMAPAAWAVTISPEIDPAAISGAMSLLIGSILVLTGKCIRK